MPSGRPRGGSARRALRVGDRDTPHVPRTRWRAGGGGRAPAHWGRCFTDAGGAPCATVATVCVGTVDSDWARPGAVLCGAAHALLVTCSFCLAPIPLCVLCCLSLVSILALLAPSVLSPPLFYRPTLMIVAPSLPPACGRVPIFPVPPGNRRDRRVQAVGDGAQAGPHRRPWHIGHDHLPGRRRRGATREPLRVGRPRGMRTVGGGGATRGVLLAASGLDVDQRGTENTHMRKKKTTRNARPRNGDTDSKALADGAIDHPLWWSSSDGGRQGGREGGWAWRRWPARVGGGVGGPAVCTCPIDRPGAVVTGAALPAGPPGWCHRLPAIATGVPLLEPPGTSTAGSRGAAPRSRATLRRGASSIGEPRRRWRRRSPPPSAVFSNPRQRTEESAPVKGALFFFVKAHHGAEPHERGCG